MNEWWYFMGGVGCGGWLAVGVLVALAINLARDDEQKGE